MDLFNKKPGDHIWNGRGSDLGEQLKTLLVAVIVGMVVISTMAVSVNYIREGKNPFEESASAGKTENTQTAREDNKDQEEPGSEAAPSDTGKENTAATGVQKEEPQKEEPQKEEPKKEEQQKKETQGESAEQKPKGPVTFEDACMVCIDRRITDEDIDAIYRTAPSNLPETPIQMAINYIYAWYGYHFKTDEIREYFQGLDWYTDRGKSIDTVNAEFSSLHRDNVKKLVELR